MHNPLQIRYFHPDRKIITVTSCYVPSSRNQLWLTFLWEELYWNTSHVQNNLPTESA